MPVWLKKSSIKAVPAPRRGRICRLPEDTRDSVQAGKRRRGARIPAGDSSGFSIMRYEDWEDIKRGIISRHKFVKMHVIVDAGGKRIVSCEVTRDMAHDSPRFRQMFAMVPDGTGCVMLNAAYDAYENYRMIRNSGRRPVIDPRKDHTLKSYNPRARMPR